jgi:hypothetical protein
VERKEAKLMKAGVSMPTVKDPLASPVFTGKEQKERVPAREVRGNHKWIDGDRVEPYHIKNEICVNCGCVKRSWWNSVKMYGEYEFLDVETGELVDRLKCLTRQYILEL